MVRTRNKPQAWGQGAMPHTADCLDLFDEASVMILFKAQQREHDQLLLSNSGTSSPLGFCSRTRMV